MKLMAAILCLMSAMAAHADDPGNPDSVYIGNLDGTPILVGLDEEITVPVWVKTDDSVAFMHIPLASQNSYVSERLYGEYVMSYCVPHMPPGYPVPQSVVFMNPDNMNQFWTNQSVVVFYYYGEALHTEYEWCHKFNYFIRTTSDPGVMGDTAYCFMEGYNPINGSILFGLTDGLTEVIPQVEYGSLYFAISNVEDNHSTPGQFIFAGAYPNPFNSSTTIEFTLPQTEDVELSIYNILGQQTAVLVDGKMEAGNHSITWDAAVAPSGIYFVKLESGPVSETIKTVLLK